MKLFDTLQQQLIDWELPECINWYSCGPTVYSHAHLGHARNYIVNDLIRRTLTNFFNVKVNLCMNITDIDDKILNLFPNGSNEQIKEFTNTMTQSFWSDMESLNVMYPNRVIHVSDSIPIIINYIQGIINNGHAYIEDGSVYFNNKSHLEIPKFIRSHDQESESDFVLWKKGKGHYESPWSIGRPGWHIECSAMATHVLGAEFDLHTGGEDLMFPHHHNEILQTMACENKRLCKYWLHVGHLHINGQKMSKSLKNFITIGDALKNYSPRMIRLCFMIHDWTKSMDFNENTMRDVIVIDKIFQDYINWHPNSSQNNFVNHNEAIKELLAMNFNFSKVIFYLKNAVSARTIDPHKLYWILNLFGLGYEMSNVSYDTVTNILIEFRKNVRDSLKRKDYQNIYKLCDSLRDVELKKYNINIDDI